MRQTSLSLYADGLPGKVIPAQVCGECQCGCGTIDRVIPNHPEGWHTNEHEIAARVLNLDDPEVPVEVQLHTANGVLRELEVVWYTDQVDKRRPERIQPSRLRWNP